MRVVRTVAAALILSVAAAAIALAWDRASTRELVCQRVAGGAGACVLDERSLLHARHEKIPITKVQGVKVVHCARVLEVADELWPLDGRAGDCDRRALDAAKMDAFFHDPGQIGLVRRFETRPQVWLMALFGGCGLFLAAIVGFGRRRP